MLALVQIKGTKTMTLDLSQELIVSPFQNGLHLSRPNSINSCTSTSQLHLKNLMEIPINFYIVTNDTKVQICNDFMLTSFGKEKHHVINQYADDFMPSKAAKLVKDNNLIVTENAKLNIIEESCQEDELTLKTLSFKWPFFDNRKKIIGVLGFSISMDAGMDEIAKNFTMLTNTGLLAPSIIKEREEMISIIAKTGQKIYFTLSESRIIRYLVEGLTAKQIAQNLNISYRTVEKHIENCRIKALVRSRRELIDIIHSSSH